VEWVWTAVAVWVLLAVPVAVLLGRVIRRADREELEARPSSPSPGQRHRRRRPGRLDPCG
jgi:hypothetical protein